jgi:hypothetical protein
MHTALSRLIGGSSSDTTLIGRPTHDDGLAAIFGVVPLLDAGIEGVQVEMQDRSRSFVYIPHSSQLLLSHFPPLYQHRVRFSLAADQLAGCNNTEEGKRCVPPFFKRIGVASGSVVLVIPANFPAFAFPARRSSRAERYFLGRVPLALVHRRRLGAEEAQRRLYPLLKSLLHLGCQHCLLLLPAACAERFPQRKEQQDAPASPLALRVPRAG